MVSSHANPHEPGAGTHRDYLRYNPSCVYYNWNYLKGADWGSAKTLWQWLGGDLGIDCGYTSEAAMASALDPLPVALRLFVRPFEVMHCVHIYAA